MEMKLFGRKPATSVDTALFMRLGITREKSFVNVKGLYTRSSDLFFFLSSLLLALFKPLGFLIWTIAVDSHLVSRPPISLLTPSPPIFHTGDRLTFVNCRSNSVLPLQTLSNAAPSTGWNLSTFLGVQVSHSLASLSSHSFYPNTWFYVPEMPYTFSCPNILGYFMLCGPLRMPPFHLEPLEHHEHDECRDRLSGLLLRT